MFKLFLLACMMALVVAKPNPNPAVIAYPSYPFAGLASAYAVPRTAALTDPVATAFAAAPFAGLSAYPYAPYFLTR